MVRDHEDDLPKQAPEKPRRRRASSKKVNDDVQKMQVPRLSPSVQIPKTTCS